MKRASAIVTNRGGRTCHAAIIARELGVPAVVGCESATDTLKDGADVTVSCAEGDTGYIYEGIVEFEQIEVSLDRMPAIPVKIAMNVGNPQLAFDFAQLPNEGVGLARLEFIISNTIGIHPKAAIEYDRLEPKLKAEVAKQARGYASPVRFYVEKIVEGCRHHRGRVLAEEGDRSPLGLQVERVPQPHRRRAVRAERGKPDARLPRRLALHRAVISRLLRPRV
jgi:pyruvate,water dikinase